MSHRREQIRSLRRRLTWLEQRAQAGVFSSDRAKEAEGAERHALNVALTLMIDETTLGDGFPDHQSAILAIAKKLNYHVGEQRRLKLLIEKIQKRLEEGKPWSS